MKKIILMLFMILGLFYCQTVNYNVDVSYDILEDGSVNFTFLTYRTTVQMVDGSSEYTDENGEIVSYDGTGSHEVTILSPDCRIELYHVTEGDKEFLASSTSDENGEASILVDSGFESERYNLVQAEVSGSECGNIVIETFVFYPSIGGSNLDKINGVIGGILGDNTSICLPFVILFGLLSASMFFAGENPLAIFDIVTPKTKRFKAVRKKISTGKKPKGIAKNTKLYLATLSQAGTYRTHFLRNYGNVSLGGSSNVKSLFTGTKTYKGLGKLESEVQMAGIMMMLSGTQGQKKLKEMLKRAKKDGKDFQMTDAEKKKYADRSVRFVDEYNKLLKTNPNTDSTKSGADSINSDTGSTKSGADSNKIFNDLINKYGLDPKFGDKTEDAKGVMNDTLGYIASLSAADAFRRQITTEYDAKRPDRFGRVPLVGMVTSVVTQPYDRFKRQIRHVADWSSTHKHKSWVAKTVGAGGIVGKVSNAMWKNDFPSGVPEQTVANWYFADDMAQVKFNQYKRGAEQVHDYIYVTSLMNLKGSKKQIAEKQDKLKDAYHEAKYHRDEEGDVQLITGKETVSSDRLKQDLKEMRQKFVDIAPELKDLIGTETTPSKMDWAVEYYNDIVSATDLNFDSTNKDYDPKLLDTKVRETFVKLDMLATGDFRDRVLESYGYNVKDFDKGTDTLFETWKQDQGKDYLKNPVLAFAFMNKFNSRDPANDDKTCQMIDDLRQMKYAWAFNHYLQKVKVNPDYNLDTAFAHVESEIKKELEGMPKKLKTMWSNTKILGPLKKDTKNYDKTFNRSIELLTILDDKYCTRAGVGKGTLKNELLGFNDITLLKDYDAKTFNGSYIEKIEDFLNVNPTLLSATEKIQLDKIMNGFNKLMGLQEKLVDIMSKLSPADRDIGIIDYVMNSGILGRQAVINMADVQVKYTEAKLHCEYAFRDYRSMLTKATKKLSHHNKEQVFAVLKKYGLHRKSSSADFVKILDEKGLQIDQVADKVMRELSEVIPYGEFKDGIEKELSNYMSGLDQYNKANLKREKVRLKLASQNSEYVTEKIKGLDIASTKDLQKLIKDLEQKYKIASGVNKEELKSNILRLKKVVIYFSDPKVSNEFTKVRLLNTNEQDNKLSENITGPDNNLYEYVDFPEAVKKFDSYDKQNQAIITEKIVDYLTVWKKVAKWPSELDRLQNIKGLDDKVQELLSSYKTQKDVFLLASSVERRNHAIYKMLGNRIVTRLRDYNVDLSTENVHANGMHYTKLSQEYRKRFGEDWMARMHDHGPTYEDLAHGIWVWNTPTQIVPYYEGMPMAMTDTMLNGTLVYNARGKYHLIPTAEQTLAKYFGSPKENISALNDLSEKMKELGIESEVVIKKPYDNYLLEDPRLIFDGKRYNTSLEEHMDLDLSLAKFYEIEYEKERKDGGERVIINIYQKTTDGKLKVVEFISNHETSEFERHDNATDYNYDDFINGKVHEYEGRGIQEYEKRGVQDPKETAIRELIVDPGKEIYIPFVRNGKVETGLRNEKRVSYEPGSLNEEEYGVLKDQMDALEDPSDKKDHHGRVKEYYSSDTRGILLDKEYKEINELDKWGYLNYVEFDKLDDRAARMAESSKFMQSVFSPMFGEPLQVGFDHIDNIVHLGTRMSDVTHISNLLATDVKDIKHLPNILFNKINPKRYENMKNKIIEKSKTISPDENEQQMYVNQELSKLHLPEVSATSNWESWKQKKSKSFIKHTYKFTGKLMEIYDRNDKAMINLFLGLKMELENPQDLADFGEIYACQRAETFREIQTSLIRDSLSSGLVESPKMDKERGKIKGLREEISNLTADKEGVLDEFRSPLEKIGAKVSYYAKLRPLEIRLKFHELELARQDKMMSENKRMIRAINSASADVWFLEHKRQKRTTSLLTKYLPASERKMAKKLVKSQMKLEDTVSKKVNLIFWRWGKGLNSHLTLKLDPNNQQEWKLMPFGATNPPYINEVLSSDDNYLAPLLLKFMPVLYGFGLFKRDFEVAGKFGSWSPQNCGRYETSTEHAQANRLVGGDKKWSSFEVSTQGAALAAGRLTRIIYENTGWKWAGKIYEKTPAILLEAQGVAGRDFFSGKTKFLPEEKNKLYEIIPRRYAGGTLYEDYSGAVHTRPKEARILYTNNPVYGRYNPNLLEDIYRDIYSKFDHQGHLASSLFPGYSMERDQYLRYMMDQVEDHSQTYMINPLHLAFKYPAPFLGGVFFGPVGAGIGYASSLVSRGNITDAKGKSSSKWGSWTKLIEFRDITVKSIEQEVPIAPLPLPLWGSRNLKTMRAGTRFVDGKPVSYISGLSDVPDDDEGLIAKGYNKSKEGIKSGYKKSKEGIKSVRDKFRRKPKGSKDDKNS